jgi:hypothetical protein
MNGDYLATADCVFRSVDSFSDKQNQDKRLGAE